MATGYSGRLVLIKKGNDDGPPETFSTIAALRDTTITFAEQTVDTTTKDDGGARALLSGSILKSMSVSGSGIFTDDSDKQELFDDFAAGTHTNYEIEVVDSATSGGATYTAAFRVTSLEFSGTFDGEAQYSLSLESDGAITAS
jgi:TP901-1 family phage major tail protein